MTKETLKKILNEKSMSFSEKEIHDMMDAELEKSPEEMDTHFVDLCLDVLDGKYGEGYYVTDRENTENADKDEEAKKAELRKKRLKISRNLLIAAVVTTILTFSATAGAKAVFVNADENLVTYITNHFNIDLKQNAMEDDTLNIVDMHPAAFCNLGSAVSHRFPVFIDLFPRPYVRQGDLMAVGNRFPGSHPDLLKKFSFRKVTKHHCHIIFFR